MASTQLDDIFAKSLLGDYDDDAPWDAVRTLRKMGSREVLEYASKWCVFPNPLKRARGADVLAQLGRTAEHPTNKFPDESFSVVSAMVQGEKDPLPLLAAIYALGHIGNPLAVPLVIEHQFHSNSDVRHAVAFALGQFASIPSAIESLMALTEDVDEDVRDWATFGLGVLGNGDSPEIRDTLVRCLSDPDENVREEAMCGLCKRKDMRVLVPLLSALEQEAVADRAIEAASEMLDMQNEREDWNGPDYATALRERFSMRPRSSSPG